MDAGDFLRTAKDLLDRACREADYRSSISRAYYAVLHTAETAVKTGVAPTVRRKAGMKEKETIHHVKLIRYLKNADDSEVVAVGDKLGSFEVERIHADYHLWRVIGREHAEDACEKAKEQCEVITGLAPERVGESVSPYLLRIHKT